QTVAGKHKGGRKRSETTGSVSSTRESGHRLSFGGSIRLNDLLNDEDDYGFAEEATEATLLEYETGDRTRNPAADTNPAQMLIEQPPREEHAIASSCPPSISPVLLAGKQRDTVASEYRPINMLEDFDGGLLYSSRDLLDEFTEASLPNSASAAACSSGAAAAAGGRDLGDRVERISLGGISVGSHDSREGGGNKSSSDGSSTGQPAKEKTKGLGALIDKAKHRFGGSKERRSATRDASLASQTILQEQKTDMADVTQPDCRPSSLALDGAAAAAVREDPLSPMLHLVTYHLSQLPFPQTRLYMGAVMVAMTMAWPGFLVGVLWGMYLSGVAFLFFFVSDPKEREEREASDGRARDMDIMNVVDDACEAFEDAALATQRQPLVVYRGWMNELPPTTRYDPSNYHVNSCRCVLVRLEGATLRISRPARAVLKHAFHTDPTLTATQPSMVAQSIYDLTDATVSLRPRRLARLRWWSRKYPIFIRLKDEKEDRQKKGGKRRKRSEMPKMKRSISMHPSSSGIAAATTAERTKREDEERRSASHDEWTTTESEWEEENATRHPSTIGNGFARARSSSEISGVDTDMHLGNEGGVGSSMTSLRRSERRKIRGIYLFARAAREKERWFHLLREACAKARIAPNRVASGSVDGTIARSRSITTMTDGLDMRTLVSPSEKTMMKEQSDGKADASMDPKTTAARELILYRKNQAHYAKSMSEAMGVSLAILSNMASSSAASAVVDGSAVAAAPSTTTPAAARAAMMMRDSSLEDETQSVNLGSMRWKPSTLPEENADLVASVNAIAGRIFFDFCRDEYWCAQVKEKIQTKLATIHLPYFIENLELSSLDLGTTTPHIENVHAPVCDEWGLWVDFEMKYSGGIRLALETRVNLLKLQSAADEKENPEESQSSAGARRSNRPATRYSDEDLPESPEDSPDEDFGAKMSAEKEKEKTGRERAASKIVSLVESAARSSIFQKAAKLSKVAKVITEISSTRLILNVEVEAIEGTMTINLPPPPSDRIWYAFRKRPKVSIRAIPQVGDRSVDLTTVSDWIESKLRLLIEKNLVCPNMDDIIIPAMSGNELLKMNYNR
ncbi:hypothetical protein PENTCL1PPCAC_9342, partial [Pristionchus entomophagus]